MKHVYTRDQIKDFNAFLKLEYLLANGTGGYSMSTLTGCHTRKYHGLLAVPVPKLDAIYMLLSKVESSVIRDREQFDLSVNEFPGVFFPKGHAFIEKIEVDDFPEITYRVDNTVIKYSILLPRCENTVLLRYENVSSSKPVILKLAPFLAYRNIHDLANQNIDIRPRTFFEKNGFKIDPYPNLPPLFLQTSRMSVFFPSPDWWRTFTYREEAARGYKHEEDLFSPGIFEVKVKKGESVILRGSLEPAEKPPEEEWEAELAYLKKRKSAFINIDEPLASLKAQAASFLVGKSEDRALPTGVIAGYPWFGVWGRDTMISLDGLTTKGGRPDIAIAILSAFAKHEKNGLLPNTLSVLGNPAFNTVDTPFLFFWAIQNYLKATGDLKQVREMLLPAMKSILKNFLDNNVGFARVGSDGLLYAGDSGTQLTWMDAQVKGRPVTSRHGAAVEINALFYNALVMLTETFGSSLDRDLAAGLSEVRKNHEKNFESAFWNRERQCLFDIVRSPEDRDPALRPNQLFALGLAHTCISVDRARIALAAVQTELLTPVGLRSLSPSDHGYIQQYAGSQEERDGAYHQGAVWAWLVGIYADAVLKTAENPGVAAVRKKELREYFRPLWEPRTAEGCQGYINELYQPTTPFAACGCPAQAWSHAELIRMIDSLAQ